MEELELKLRTLLTRLQGIPKTETERVYLESLIIQLVSAQQIIRKVERASTKLECLNTLLSTGEHLEALKWLDNNPLPRNDVMSGAKELGLPKEIIDLGRQMISSISDDDQPTALEVWSFLRGVYVGTESMNPDEVRKIITIQAIAMSEEVLNADNDR